jgi:CDP-glycerol glycerophosphotransferase
MRTETPTISVVVPVYRVEAYLDECLRSILADHGDDLEVIAVNDSSPDRCGEILDEYARRDSRLRVVHLSKNVGLGLARNAGLAYATGDYVWFIDSDDWLPAGAVAAVRARLAITRPDVLIIDHAEVHPGGRTIARRSADLLGGIQPPLHLGERPQLLRLAQAAWSKPVRRSFLHELGLRFGAGWYEDCAYSHPLLMAAASIDVLDEVCYFYRQRPTDRITTTISNRHFEVFDQYENLFMEVDAAGRRYEPYRAELFRLMINHYLVILGNTARLPARSRRDFFRRIVEHYRRWLPDGGYQVPPGVTGIKHHMVRRDAWPAYAALRHTHLAAGKLRQTLRSPEASPRRVMHATSTSQHVAAG